MSGIARWESQLTRTRDDALDQRARGGGGCLKDRAPLIRSRTCECRSSRRIGDVHSRVVQILESATGPLLRVSDLACMIIIRLDCPFPFFVVFFSAEGRFLPDVVGLARTGATLLLLLWRMGQWRWILLGLVPCWTGGSSSFRSTRCRVFGLCSMDPPPISRPRGGTGLAGRLPRSVDMPKNHRRRCQKLAQKSIARKATNGTMELTMGKNSSPGKSPRLARSSPRAIKCNRLSPSVPPLA
jgi:hypothetical protein